MSYVTQLHVAGHYLKLQVKCMTCC